MVNLSGLNPIFAARISAAIAAAEAATGAKASFRSGVRDRGTQQRLYAAYKSGTGGIAAPPGKSLHEQGMAIDFDPGPVRDWIQAHAAQYGLEAATAYDRNHKTWGRDPPHIQLARSTLKTQYDSTPSAFAGGRYNASPAVDAVNEMAAGGQSRTLSKGMTGDDVRALQQQLADAGLYKGKIDGDYGKQTAAAVRAAESRYGLSRDRGVAGPQVQTALGNAGSAQRIASTIDTFGAPGGGSAAPTVSSVDYALNGAPPWAGPASQFSVGAGTMPGGAPEPSAPWQNPLNAGPRISQASRVPMFPIQAPVKGYGGADVSFTPHQPPSPAPVASSEGDVPMSVYRQYAAKMGWPGAGQQSETPFAPVPMSADTMAMLDARIGGQPQPDPAAEAKAWLEARGSKAPPQGFGANNLYNAGETAPWDKPFDANELVGGIGNFFDPNGTGFSLGAASRGLNDLFGGSEPVTAEPNAYDRIKPAVPAPSVGPQSSLGGYPQVAAAGIPRADQFAQSDPDPGPGAFWYNNGVERTLVAPPESGAKAFPDQWEYKNPPAPDPNNADRYPPIEASMSNDYLAGGPGPDFGPAGGQPLQPNGPGYSVGGFGAPGSISWDAPSMLPQAMPSPSPAQTQSILPPQKEPSRPGGTQGGRFGDYSGKGNQVYATSLPYTNMGTTPWGSSFFGTPNGSFSNSPYTPAGWTAPNFNSKNGGNSYAYDPVSRTYMTSDGRVLSMD